MLRIVVVIILAGLSALRAEAFPLRPPRPWELDRLNAKLKGRVLDFTHNHGADRRIGSEALKSQRDMYVYLPPCYDASKQYPLLIWLHGFSQDEYNTKSLAKAFDSAVSTGKIPPMIIAIPDGTFKGYPMLINSGSFYINGVRGRYEDFLAQDVWNFLMCRFPIRPEREAHVIAGASMGGTSAFAIAFKHKDKFGVVVGIMPLLDLLYADCHGNHKAPFDPNCLGRIEHYRPRESAGRIMGINIRYGSAMRPLFGNNRQEVERRLRGENPVEMLELYDVQPGEFSMFIAFGEHDQFNGAAEARSFVYYANCRGVTADVVVDPNGRHSKKTGMGFFDEFGDWISPLLAPYAP